MKCGHSYCCKIVCNIHVHNMHIEVRSCYKNNTDEIKKDIKRYCTVQYLSLHTLLVHTWILLFLDIPSFIVVGQSTLFLKSEDLSLFLSKKVKIVGSFRDFIATFLHNHYRSGFIY